MTTERERLLAEKARIEAEHPDKCFTDGVRQLAEIIREQRTANWLSVAAVLDHCAENIDRLHAAAPQPSAELAKLDAEPDWGPAAKAFWQGAYPGHDDMHPTTEAEVIRGLIAAAPLIPRDAVSPEAEDLSYLRGVAHDMGYAGILEALEALSELRQPRDAGMSEDEIEALAREVSIEFLESENNPQAAENLRNGGPDRTRAVKGITLAIRETLKRAPLVRWPGEGAPDLAAFVDDIARQWLPDEPEPAEDFHPAFEDAYCIIVRKARRLKAHLTGEGK
jgi:hypothetical protein